MTFIGCVIEKFAQNSGGFKPFKNINLLYTSQFIRLGKIEINLNCPFKYTYIFCNQVCVSLLYNLPPPVNPKCRHWVRMYTRHGINNQ